MVLLKCPKVACGHVWNYLARDASKKRFYTACPLCHGNVKIVPEIVANGTA